MRTQSFNYNLPKKLIAQKPSKNRDGSRLMILNKKTKMIDTTNHFFDLEKILNKDDVLVLNNSKVFPARLIGQKETGGKIEVFLLNEKINNTWKCLIGSRKKSINLKIIFKNKLNGIIIKQVDESTWLVKFNKNPLNAAEKIGLVPTPPYIKQIKNQSKLKKQYQTIYAKKTGSVAAPTAGLHFTKKILDKLKNKGIKIEYITLHVGLGTFKPIKEKDLKKIKLHPEYACIDKKTANRLNKYKTDGKRIISVGTTTCRTLEAFTDRKNHLKPDKKWVDIFIYPPYKFKFVDCLITNFHLPKSSLLMLVSALANKKLVDIAYKKAIQNKWRFYSFGDAMLIE